MAAVWCPAAGARYAFVCFFVIINSLFSSLLLLYLSLQLLGGEQKKIIIIYSF